MFSVNDFRDYRNALGFGSQAKFREFLSAKDIVANIDFSYIDLLNSRLCEIFTRLNGLYYKPCDINEFLQEKLFRVYSLLKSEQILNKLNNQGRRKEEVYFS